MTKDDILKMAHEAGFNWPEVHTTTTEERLERLIALASAKAAAEENEACALVCEGVAKEFGGVAEGTFVTDFGKHTHQAMAAGAMNGAAAIRARHNTQKEQSE